MNDTNKPQAKPLTIGKISREIELMTGIRKKECTIILRALFLIIEKELLMRRRFNIHNIMPFDLHVDMSKKMARVKEWVDNRHYYLRYVKGLRLPRLKVTPSKKLHDEIYGVAAERIKQETGANGIDWYKNCGGQIRSSLITLKSPTKHNIELSGLSLPRGYKEPTEEDYKNSRFGTFIEMKVDDFDELVQK